MELPILGKGSAPTSTDISKASADKETPAIPVTPADTFWNVFMNTGFNGQPSFVPFFYSASQPNPIFYDAGFPCSNSSNALVSVNPGMSHAILNPPGLQQPMQYDVTKSPLDLNAPGPQLGGSANSDGVRITAQGQVLSAAPLDMQSEIITSTVDPKELSLLPTGTSMSQDIGDIQTGNFVNDLGFVPTPTIHAPVVDARDNGGETYTITQPNHLPRSPLPTIMTSDYTTAPQPSLIDSTMDTDNGHPEFEFNTFINVLTLQKNAGEDTIDGLHEFNLGNLESLVPNAGGASTSPHLSAFVDEINSTSSHSEEESMSKSHYGKASQHFDSRY